MNKQYCKSFIGKTVIDKRQNRTGIIDCIQFNSKNWAHCWFYFKWVSGAYLVSLDDIELINTPTRANDVTQLNLFS